MKDTSQSAGARGQRFYAFLVTVLALNLTLWIATVIGAPQILAEAVIQWECIIGIVLVLGRSAKYVIDAWASMRTGRIEEKVVTEKTVTKE